jgi:aspartate/glutamate racemase
VHSECDKLYNEGMSPEDIQVVMAKKDGQEDVVKSVYEEVGPGLFRASGFKKRVKDIMEGIRGRVTRRKRNILKSD